MGCIDLYHGLYRELSAGLVPVLQLSDTQQKWQSRLSAGSLGSKLRQSFWSELRMNQSL